MMDAAARDGALRHAETCAACAARLAREQHLTTALRTIATDMADLSAPARVEAKLLAAFLETRANAQAATTTDAHDASHAPIATPAHGAAVAPVELSAQDEVAARRASSRRQTWRAASVATAIAASLALVALVTLYKQFTRTVPSSQTTNVAPQQGGRESTPVAPVVATLSPPPNSAGSTGQAKPERPQPIEHAASARTHAKLARPFVPRMIESRQVIDGGSAIFAAGEGESAANHAGGASKPNETESVTEFISLVAGAPAATPLESGQLVRVQLPRAALASLGLPLNAERDNEPVKADVLLGNDGLARAIRFVR
ncbi:MAG: hypothetical protein QOD32_3512 [Pyrinomonadaceae bacterium]|nr:hypothetical protein [Pyrinomonadaceae bacterium]